MARSLPTYTIEGTSFLIDVANSELKQADDAANTISFHDMLDRGTYYTFSYDKTRKNLAPAVKPISESIVRVTMPQMVHLDPEGMAVKYNLKPEDLQHKNDFDIVVDQRLLGDRLSGLLPLIRIAGRDFMVDLRLNELRALDDPKTRINLSKLDVSRDGENFLCFYDMQSRQQVKISPSLTELPATVVLLEIPNELHLDPVGVARRNGLADTALLRRFPFQKNLEAKVIPTSKTGLPALISKNRQAMNEQRATKAKKRKKGRGL